MASAKLMSVEAEGRRRKTEDEDEDIPGIDRLLALTDGVVAIALDPARAAAPGPLESVKADPDSASALWDALSPTSLS